MKNKKISEKTMPLQRGVDRFYYPINEKRTDIASVYMRQSGAKDDFLSKNDPNGSYTGIPTDGGVPTQDADDL